MTDGTEGNLDKMVSETKALIDQANEVTEGLRRILKEMGCDAGDTVHKLFQSGECPSDLRKQASEEIEKVHRELAEEEDQLRQATDKQNVATRPRSGMTKI